MSIFASNKKYVIKGGGLKATTLQALLTGSYTGDEVVDGFRLDKEISSDTARVYIHPSNQVVVAHRGTYSASDWANNGVYGLTGEAGYKQTLRYKNSEKVQKLAEKKYGAGNVTTIGHSQGALLARMLGKNTKEVITLNQATRPEDLFRTSKPKKQYDVRSDGDAVSMWKSPFQNNKKDINIRKKNNDILNEHSVDVLGRLNNDRVIGKRNTYVN